LLPLSAEAFELWRQFHDDVETEIGKRGEYTNVKDIGAKTAENAARLAGVFHVLVYGPAGEIDAEMMWRAIQIVLWHLSEAQRILDGFDVSQGVADALLIFEWLLRVPPPDGLIDSRYVLQFGPNALRSDKKRREAALDILAEHKILLSKLHVFGKGRRYILNPRIKELI